MLQKLGLNQPPNGTAISFVEAARIAKQIGYPVLVRPSYVLGGRAMEIVYDETDLKDYMERAVQASPDHPILVDKFLEDAIEMDVDAVSDGKTVVIGGIMEHIEEAGIHSGDSACSLPPWSVSGRLLDVDPGADPGHGAGAGRDRADQHPVRHQGQGGVRAGGQPARLAHGAVREQGDRRSSGQAGGQGDAGGDACRSWASPRSGGSPTWR